VHRPRPPHHTGTRGQECRRSTSASNTHTPNTTSEDQEGSLLLRKEVIQPHLPVRLPCYDLVPIASPTFDGSLPQRG
jgi:hypothetical protein